MANAQVGYVIDTCAFSHLTGENRADRFTTDGAKEERVWRGLEQLITDGRLVTSMWVRPEMREWCPLAYERVRSFRKFFLRDTPEIFAAMRKAFAVAEPRTRRYISSRPAGKEVADPYLIGIAMVLQFKIVTGELERTKRSAKRQKEEKIPDWSRKLTGVVAIQLEDLVRSEGWS